MNRRNVTWAVIVTMLVVYGWVMFVLVPRAERRRTEACARRFAIAKTSSDSLYVARNWACPL